MTEPDQFIAQIGVVRRHRLTLAEARKKAAALRELAKAGANVIAERDKERKATPTFAEAMKDAHEALAGGCRQG